MGSFCALEVSQKRNRIGWVARWTKAHLGGCDVARHKLLGNCVVQPFSWVVWLVGLLGQRLGKGM